MRIASPAEMEALGHTLAPLLASHGGVVYLHGPLGAGKTTLVRGLLHALGHEGSVRSPTYALLESYAFDEVVVHHLDLYRLQDPQELEYIGLYDLLDAGVICLIEWPERGGDRLPMPQLELVIEALDQNVREVRWQARDAHGEQVIRALDFSA
ncbi:MAG: tRNA (adenosine(37)-N6)-threonylcarbamoyltransferase complex ATPase subunit type 1 TsaE [Chromatiales bacterium]|jgi:tRNA threonylcarbamoyladenosine biosynthesis protein TsaE|nr:tRNA (adenosine(37)-N6)-threonylcarbamoyltransferase complex ATPase subunit type 1 TsaE [Chromatiales bacterium]